VTRQAYVVEASAAADGQSAGCTAAAKAATTKATAAASVCRNGQLSEEAILWAIYSISDNNSYLLFNR